MFYNFYSVSLLEKLNWNNAKPEVVNKLNKKTQWKAWEIYVLLGQTIKAWRQEEKLKYSLRIKIN